MDSTWSKNEGCSIPPEVSKHLRVAQELSEVDVEEMPALLDHDVVVVTVADAQHVRHDGVAGAGVSKVLDRVRELQLLWRSEKINVSYDKNIARLGLSRLVIISNPTLETFRDAYRSSKSVLKVNVATLALYHKAVSCSGH